METLTITKDQLRAALLRWEEDARDGKTLSHDEADALPVDQVAAESAERLWAELQHGHIDPILEEHATAADSALAAENAALKLEVNIFKKAAEQYAKDAERWHAELQLDAFDDLRRSAQRCIIAWTVVRGRVQCSTDLMDEHMAALRKALAHTEIGRARIGCVDT